MLWLYDFLAKLDDFEFDIAIIPLIVAITAIATVIVFTAINGPFSTFSTNRNCSRIQTDYGKRGP